VVSELFLFGVGDLRVVLFYVHYLVIAVDNGDVLDLCCYVFDFQGGEVVSGFDQSMNPVEFFAVIRLSDSTV